MIEQKPLINWILDSIDWNSLNKIPEWIDPRESAFWNKGKSKMPSWIQELADWSMKTGNRKKIDTLLQLAYGDKYKTPWTKEQIEEFKYGNKIKEVKKPAVNNKNIVQKYWDAINPKEVYHRNPKEIIDIIDINKSGIRPDGSTYRPSFGKGAYVSIQNNPALNEHYGNFVSKYFVNPDAQLISSKNADLYGIFQHPYFQQEEGFGPRFKKWLDNKGYAGIDNEWENVFYKPERDLLPANTVKQRFVNRFFNAPAIKYGSKIINRVATPLAILEGMGLNQPVGQGSDIVPQYPENNTLYGYINNNQF